MAPQTPEQPRLYWESAPPDQQEHIKTLDGLVREDPQAAASTLDKLLKDPKGVELDERQQEIARAVGAVLSFETIGKRLVNGIIDDKTFDTLTEHPTYRNLVDARRKISTEDEIDRQIARLALLVYAQRVIENSAPGEPPLPHPQHAENQTDRIAA